MNRRRKYSREATVAGLGFASIEHFVHRRCERMAHLEQPHRQPDRQDHGRLRVADTSRARHAQCGPRRCRRNRAAGVLSIQWSGRRRTALAACVWSICSTRRRRTSTSIFRDAKSGVPTCGSLVVGTLDAGVLGTPVNDAIIVAASLDHLGSPQLYVDPEALAGLFQNIDFDLKALIFASAGTAGQVGRRDQGQDDHQAAVGRKSRQG